MSFHGGLAGVFVAILIFTRRHHYKFSHIGDWLVLPAPLGLFAGRMGNFFNAELYGTQTTGILGMRFPMYDKVGGYERWAAMPSALRPYTEPRHASQLYEALLEGLVLFAILQWIKRYNPKRGVLAWSFVAGYGIFRFVVEFWREPSIAWSLGWFTSGMAYSLPMFLVGAAIAIHLQRTSSSRLLDGASPYRNEKPPVILEQQSKGTSTKPRPRTTEKKKKK
jgi:phosphatidylglycerol:prolipoprotein diacylglycerol transferase